MREIKFRAWIHRDCGGGVPLECYETMDYSGNYQNDLSEFFGLYNPLFFDVMQYTGLKDKNGKEIYKGDVVGRKGFYHRVVCHNGTNFKQYWTNNPMGVKMFTKNSIDEYDEVIGNIHENPELLKD